MLKKVFNDRHVNPRNKLKNNETDENIIKKFSIHEIAKSGNQMSRNLLKKKLKNNKIKNNDDENNE